MNHKKDLKFGTGRRIVNDVLTGNRIIAMSKSGSMIKLNRLK